MSTPKYLEILCVYTLCAAIWTAGNKIGIKLMGIIITHTDDGCPQLVKEKTESDTTLNLF